MPTTPILPADADTIAQAATIIRRGGLVAFPTETVYGLGADATSIEAVGRIFAAKGRPLTDPVIVHLADADQIASIAGDLPDAAMLLADSFMPGALTLIVPRGDRIPAIVSAGRDTVAVRVPSHPVAHALIRAAGVPIAAPSANNFSRPSATSAAHVLFDLDGRIDLILDGGASPIGVESTIVDLTTTPPTLRRPGGISIEAIRAVVPDLAISTLYGSTDQAMSAPGQMLRHYSPRAVLHLYTTAPDGDSDALTARVNADMAEAAHPIGAILTGFPLTPPATAATIVLGGDPDWVGANLFSALRALDSTGAAAIYIVWTRHDGIGAAIWDRLVRAAEGQVIYV
ncbi:MAG: L-threonylcarbamoyladenylate synthase [Chloroflexota bacterium]|nr:L-threonylcarbamoyladenylate synthase [Chloroflexota bacterium]